MIWSKHSTQLSISVAVSDCIRLFIPATLIWFCNSLRNIQLFDPSTNTLQAFLLFINSLAPINPTTLTTIPSTQPRSAYRSPTYLLCLHYSPYHPFISRPFHMAKPPQHSFLHYCGRFYYS